MTQMPFRHHPTTSRAGAMIKAALASLVLLALFVSSPARAQLLQTQTLSLQAAKTMAAAAEAKARENNWNVAIAIVDASGGLILFHRLDDVQPASHDIAIGKARTAARFRRPTRALEDAVAGGRTVLLAVEGMVPLEGGVPIVVDGRVIGAVGVSGVTSLQDAQVARAAIGALRP